MWVLALEAGLALGLFLFIIWWTLPKKKKSDDADQETNKNNEPE
ncbi:MAG: hypothetical protein RQ714_08130 [Nitrosomonas sp.]|nr:hypothetical protein [Nitrosomonas sp.]